jgi:hypothetical protein
MKSLPELDKKMLSVASLDEVDEEKIYWQKAEVRERLRAIEMNRRMVYGRDRISSRLQRFLETSEFLRC